MNVHDCYIRRQLAHLTIILVFDGLKEHRAVMPYKRMVRYGMWTLGSPAVQLVAYGTACVPTCQSVWQAWHAEGKSRTRATE